MKLTKARFENFRILRNLELDFISDRLTVIRAENESGKTTILNALQWGLYGDSSLPDDGINYRLSPIDSDVSNGGLIAVSVQIDFEKTTFRKSRSGDLIETEGNYRIIRTAHEIVVGTDHRRNLSTVRLYRITDKGSEPIDPPEAWINKELPSELREIFFTDGDRALSFIEVNGDAKTKRERVQEAIQSLLGLEIIEKAVDHLRKTNTEFNKEVKSIVSNEELEEISDKLEKIDMDLAKLKESKDDAKHQFDRFAESLNQLDKRIEQALIRGGGDREQLNQDLIKTQSELKQIDNKIKETSKEHSQLFESLSLSRDLLAPILEKTIGMLSELRKQGKLPNTTIPILEERLIEKTCICGESLDPKDTDSRHRIARIEGLIEESRKPDALQNTLTALYYKTVDCHPNKVNKADHWLVEYNEVATQRDELDKKREEIGKNLKALEVQLEEIPDTDIQELRTTKKEHIAQRDRFNAEYVKYTTQIEDLEEERKSLSATQNNLLRNQRRGKRSLAKLDVVQDVEKVLKNSYNRIKDTELDKVSSHMNKLFLEMIGADPEQGSIIRKADISKEYDILVYGPDERKLNPDVDINGASRRALTLAFILALTRISGVNAPNVIDTPLGMMSGYVKKSVLRTAIRESTQLILFLTRSEIQDCEEILDSEAGRIITLTNSAHYPEMLINDPKVDSYTVLKCSCNHRKECEICMRRTDLENETPNASNEVESES